jgi:hypothetical protein
MSEACASVTRSDTRAKAIHPVRYEEPDDAAGSSSAKAARLSGFGSLASVLAFGALYGLIGAIIGVPTAAGLPIVAEELTAGRRARIAAADVAERQQPA